MSTSMISLVFLPFVFSLVAGSCVVDIPDCDCPVSPMDAICSDIGLIRVPRTFARLRILRLPLNYIQSLYDDDVSDLNVAVLDLRGMWTGCVTDKRIGDHPLVVYGLCDKVCRYPGQYNY